MKKYLFPIFYTISIMLIGTLISSILYYFNVTTDKLNIIFLYCTSILSMFIGSLNLSKKIKFKGIITGSIYFVCFFILMLLISFIFFKSKFSFKNIIYYFVLLIFSILGGILGKNSYEQTDTN